MNHFPISLSGILDLRPFDPKINRNHHHFMVSLCVKYGDSQTQKPIPLWMRLGVSETYLISVYIPPQL